MPLLLTSAAPAVSPNIQPNHALKMSAQLVVSGAGNVSSTAVLEGSHDGQGWLSIANMTASGSGYATDGGTFETLYPMVRARLTAVSGGTAFIYWMA